MKYTITIILMFCLAFMCHGQTHKDVQSLSLDVSQYDEVHLYNKYGEVKVSGVSGSVAKVNSNRKLKSKSSRKLGEAKATIYLDTFTMDNILVVYINNPFYYLDGEYDDRFFNYRSKDEYSGSNNWKKINVDFEFDIDFQVPRTTNLVVATHKGKLSVEDIAGELAARNHHSDISLREVSNLSYVHTHHGDIKASLDQLPSRDIDFDTHHGDITVSLPGIPSAEISFDSHHGEFYTDFDWKAMSPKTHTVSSKSKHKTKYKLGDKTLVQMGDGKYKLTFDTHHGDMYLLQL